MGNSARTIKKPLLWSNDEGEDSDYASSASSEQTGIMLVNMADNNHDDDPSVYRGPRADFQGSASSSEKYPANVGIIPGTIPEQPEQW